MMTPCTASRSREGSGHGADDPPSSSAEHDAAEHHRGDRGELVAAADGRVHPRVPDEQDGGEGGREGGQHERAGRDPGPAGTGVVHRAGVVADRDEGLAQRALGDDDAEGEPGGEQEDGPGQEFQHGEVAYPAATDLPEAVGRVPRGRAARPPHHAAEQGEHHAQRHDERRHLEQRREDAVHEPDDHAEHDHEQQDREGAGVVLADEVAGDDDLRRDERSLGEVELPRDDHEVLPDRDDRDGGDALQIPHELPGLGEARVEHGDRDEQDHEQQEDRPAGANERGIPGAVDGGDLGGRIRELGGRDRHVGFGRLRGVVSPGARAAGAEAGTTPHDGPPTVDGDRGDDDDAAHHVLEEGIHLQHAHDVVDDGEDGDAADGAPDRAASAEEQGAAEHDRGDGEQRVATLLTDRRAADAETAGEQESGEAREHGAQHVRPDQREAGAHTAEPRDLGVAADGVEMGAGTGAVQQHPDQHGERDRDERGHRDRSDAGRADELERPRDLARRAFEERRDHGERDVPRVPGHHRRREQARQADDIGDRQVERGPEHHERLPDGHEAEHAHPGQDVADVPRAEEVATDRGDEDRADDEREQQDAEHDDGRVDAETGSGAAAHRAPPFLGDEFAVVHDEDAVAHADDLRQLARDHEHGLPLCRQLAHELVDGVLGAHVDPPRRLVEEHDLRLGEQPLRQHHLLLVAAGQEAHLLVEAARRHLQRAEHPRHLPARRRGASREHVPHHEQGVVEDRLPEREPLRLAVLGDEGEPGAHGRAWSADPHRLPVDPHGAAGEGLDAEHALHQLGAPRPLEPGHPDDLPRTERQRHRVHVGVPAAVELESGRADRRAGHRVGEVRLDRPPHHPAHELVGGQRRGLVRGNEGAVLEDRDPVAEVEDLLQPVRDVDDGDPSGREPADDRVQQLHLAVAEGGGRLVHRDHLRVERQRLHDLDDLLLGHRQRAHPGLRIDEGDAEIAQQLPGTHVHGPDVDEPRAPRLPAEIDVLRDRALREQGELLEHRDDAGVHRLPRVHVAHFRAAVRDRPLVGRLHARDDLHEGGLARAVLADEAVHLPGPHVEVDALQHLHAEERLADPGHPQHRLRRRRGHAGTSVQRPAWAAESSTASSIGDVARDRGVDVGDETVEGILIPHGMPGRDTLQPGGLRVGRGGVAQQQPRLLAHADPELLRPFLLEPQTLPRPVQLQGEGVLAARRHLRDEQRAERPRRGLDEHGDDVLRVDGLSGPLGEDPAGPGAQGADPVTRDELEEVAQMRADVGERAGGPAGRGAHPPVVVGGPQHPVLQVRAVQREQLPGLAAGDARPGLPHHGVVAVHEGDGRDQPALGGFRGERGGVGGGRGEGLLAHDMLARPQRAQGEVGMRGVRGADVDDVDVIGVEQRLRVVLGARGAEQLRGIPRALGGPGGDGAQRAARVSGGRAVHTGHEAPAEDPGSDRPEAGVSDIRCHGGESDTA
ncbi:unnamed protein product, partial [Penicillium discolor]